MGEFGHTDIVFESCSEERSGLFEKNTMRVIILDNDNDGRSVRDIMEFDILQVTERRMLNMIKDRISGMYDDEIKVMDCTMNRFSPDDAPRPVWVDGSTPRKFNKLFRDAVSKIKQKSLEVVE